MLNCMAQQVKRKKNHTGKQTQNMLYSSQSGSQNTLGTSLLKLRASKSLTENNNKISLSLVILEKINLKNEF